MLISLALLAGALFASPATATISPNAVPVASPLQPGWKAVHSDTVGDLLFTTEALGGRVRFVARGLKGSVPVTTSDFSADSVRTWVTSASGLVSGTSVKQGEMRGLGQALTLNVTTATTGETVFGFYVGDAVSDQQLALALTRESALKLTNGVTAALGALDH